MKVSNSRPVTTARRIFPRTFDQGEWECDEGAGYWRLMCNGIR
jgi:hypothetical protein